MPSAACRGHLWKRRGPRGACAPPGAGAPAAAAAAVAGAGVAGFADLGMEPVISAVGEAPSAFGPGAAWRAVSIGMTMPGAGVAMVVPSTAGKRAGWRPPGSCADGTGEAGSPAAGPAIAPGAIGRAAGEATRGP